MPLMYIEMMAIRRLTRVKDPLSAIHYYGEHDEFLVSVRESKKWNMPIHILVHIV